MLQPYLEDLYAKGIILASGSQVRQNLLRQIDLQFTVQVSGFPEDSDWRTFESPQAYALFNARNKANLINTSSIIIAADSVAELDGHVYEKPNDKEDARQILKSLCGR